jgi:hypothetical protein
LFTNVPFTPKHENILTDDARLPNDVVMGYGSPQHMVSPRPTFQHPMRRQHTTHFDGRNKEKDVKVNSIGMTEDEIFEYNIIDKDDLKEI